MMVGLEVILGWQQVVGKWLDILMIEFNGWFLLSFWSGGDDEDVMRVVKSESGEE